METIGDLLERDLTKRIEEIINLSQLDEHSVHTEITEYVATDRIKDEYRKVLKAMLDAITEPHEGVGVWVSGFFGSGKSSFAKNLGYILGNRTVLGKSAPALLKARFQDDGLTNYIDLANARIPAEVVMFDVSVDRAVKKGTERIAEVLYTVLLRTLDYAEDFDVAELEIELEAEGKLEEFTRRCAQEYGEWRTVRTGAQKVSRASAVLHLLDRRTYPSPDSWARSLTKSADITVGRLVERTFDLMARRRPGKAPIFIVDEVGQYVARSADKILDLQAIVRELGKEGKNRLKAKKAVSPAWLVVTSQEKLDEVVNALESKRVEIAKLQDSFKHRVDLSPEDIRQVATRRVLAKTRKAEPVLRKLYEEHEGKLGDALRLERTTRRSEVSQDDFVQFYPYPPHFVELSIDIMSGIRLQPGAFKHLGGSNRTIIKQAYEMLVSDRTAMARAAVGALVSLDKIYELVEGNLSSERRKDIGDITESFKKDRELDGMAARVAKVVCLLEFVRDLPRTEDNIAACLVDEVGRKPPKKEVGIALRKLQEAQFVRRTDEGWKLQSAHEKSWDTERRGLLDPRPRQRQEIVRKILEELFDEASLKAYRYKDLKTLRVGITVDGVGLLADAGVPLALLTAAEDECDQRRAEAKQESIQSANANQGYWVLPLGQDLATDVAELHASQEMVSKYEQMRARNQISPAEGSCLEAEKTEAERLRKALRASMLEALQAGSGYFRGVAKDGSSLGRTAPEIFRAFFDYIVPQLYPKLELGARHVEGNEAEEVLRAANLNGLSPVFYEGDKGLGLVVQQGKKYVPNPDAPIAKEVLDHLRREHGYGNKVTGKSLEHAFRGIGYGWDMDVLRPVLAVLLRAGAIEVTSQGRRFRNYQDPQCRQAFSNTHAFRAASFAPRETIDLKTLTAAVQQYEEITGEEVDVEEGAIDAAFKRVAQEELRETLKLEATVSANDLPGAEMIAEYREMLHEIETSPSDDTVRLLAGEGRTFKETRDRLRRMRSALDARGVATVKEARRILGQVWPILEKRPGKEGLEGAAADLGRMLGASDFHERLPEIEGTAGRIRKAYATAYLAAHKARGDAYAAVIERVRGMAAYAQLSADLGETTLAPLASRACGDDRLDGTGLQCAACGAGLGQLEADATALPEIERRVRDQLIELTRPPEDDQKPTERVRVAEFFPDAIRGQEDLDAALERLREHLQKLVERGARIILE